MGICYIELLQKSLKDNPEEKNAIIEAFLVNFQREVWEFLRLLEDYDNIFN